VTDFDPADIAAVHAEGDLPRLLREEIAKGQARKAKPAPAVPPPPPGRRPGAWPTGANPPDPPPPIPPAEVERALAEYRQWLADGQPPGAYRCDCTSCQLLPGRTE
jgi:hypothetical protein